MGLWNRLFGRPRQPAPDAVPPPADRQAFLRRIALHGAWAIAKDVRGDQVSFIDYLDDRGQHIWPLFSSQDTAATWVSHSGVRQVMPFACFHLKPAAILSTVPAGARVVFDEKSRYERVVTSDDLELLGELVGPPQGHES